MLLITRLLDLSKGDHNTPEYKAINPTSTVPALVDGDMKIFDSSAIAIYLVEKYAKNDSLYPKDLKKRTKVNEKLFYVGNYMFPRLFQIYVSGFFLRETEISQTKLDEVYRGYSTIEEFLNGNNYLVGSAMTLPDLFLWTSMESLAPLITIDEKQFPNFIKWLNRMREHPAHKMNKKYADQHVAFYRLCVEQAKQGATARPSL